MAGSAGSAARIARRHIPKEKKKKDRDEPSRAILFRVGTLNPAGDARPLGPALCASSRVRQTKGIGAGANPHRAAAAAAASPSPI